MKEILAQDIMLTYPQFDKPFHVYTDTSESQIRGIIMQENKPYAIRAQQVVHTDHKNLTHPNSKHSSDRVLSQRLVLEEYGMEINYISGNKKIVIDALSRLPTEELFILKDNNFPLNLEIMAEKQAADQHLQTQLLCEPSKYKQTVRDGVEIYTNPATQAIYILVSPHNAVLQLYHTSLQHPSI
jgi:hypothetical protein